MDCKNCRCAEEIKEIKILVEAIEKAITGGIDDINNKEKRGFGARILVLESKVKLFSKMFLLNIVAIIGGLVGTLWR